MHERYVSSHKNRGCGTDQITFQRLIEHFKKHDGVEFVTMAEIADDFKKRNQPAEGALMPAKAGAILEKS